MHIFKVHIFKVKIMIFPVVMCGCESCTIRRWVLKSWSFRTVLLEKTLGVPWTAKRSNQLLLKESNPEYSLKGLMLKLKLQYFSHLKSWLIGKDPDAGKDWGQEEKGAMVGWRHCFKDMSLSNSRRQWRTRKPCMPHCMVLKRVGHGLATEQQQQK